MTIFRTDSRNENNGFVIGDVAIPFEWPLPKELVVGGFLGQG